MVTTLQIPDRDHGGIAGKMLGDNDPGAKAVMEFIEKTAAARAAAPSK